MKDISLLALEVSALCLGGMVLAVSWAPWAAPPGAPVAVVEVVAPVVRLEPPPPRPEIPIPMPGTGVTLNGLGLTLYLGDEGLIAGIPFEDTPAEAAGVVAGDRVVGINGRSAERMSIREAVLRLNAPIGVAVQLQVERNGVLQPPVELRSTP